MESPAQVSCSNFVTSNRTESAKPAVFHPKNLPSARKGGKAPYRGRPADPQKNRPTGLISIEARILCQEKTCLLHIQNTGLEKSHRMTHGEHQRPFVFQRP
jgi:hypothetical protein